jgi:hypothetical protein
MANYAVIEHGEVTGKLCIELPEIDAGLGDTWDGEKFIRPILETEETA